MNAPLALAALSAVCFGVALVTGRVGLRTLDPRSGAAISIPTATVLFLVASPFALDTSGFDVRAALLFGLVGLVFPALVTILTFHSNERLGPTMTGAVSGTAPLFAILAAGLFLGESIPARATLAAGAIVVGVGLLSWKRGAAGGSFLGWSLLWPLFGALLRGLAQAGAKAGLALWPSPFAAGLIGYSVSSATVIGVNRFGRRGRSRFAGSGVVWFALTGLLNGGAVFLMYIALNTAPVSLVAPVVATYPLVTVLVSALLLREERVTLPMVAGAIITVMAVAYLVGAKTGA
jgi:drug/metabolite transporter (DMT)-like permease